MSTSESDIVSRIAALNAPQQSEPAAESAAQPNAEPAPAERPEPQGTAEDVGEQPDTRAEGSGEGGTDAPASGGDDAAEEIEIGDLNDLANHLGVDPADLYNIAVPYTEGGQKKEFTLGELKDKYTQFAETETLRAESQAKLQAYQQAEAQAVELIQAHAVQAAAIQRAMEQQLLADFSGVDWARIQTQNPAEYIRLQQNLQSRQAQLEQMRHNAVQFMEEQGNALKAQREHLQRERLLREQQALMKAIPEWRDESVANAERQQLAQYMLQRGYSEEEINAVDDHRALLLVRDAMRFRQMNTSAETAKKKVVKLAKKIVTPGSRQTAGERNTDAERGLRRTLKQSGSVQDAATLISLRLGRKK